MWLTTPDTIEHILVERQLEPVSDDTLNQSARDWQNRGVKLSPQDALRDMPVVSIGWPKACPLPTHYSPEKLPHSTRSKRNQADFYNQEDFHLIRFDCNFLTKHKESRIEWARFRVTLLPDPSTGAQPRAFDMYPQQVVQEEKREVKVTLSPQFKFQELEASIGNAEFVMQFTKQVPLISAAIGTASIDPSWDFGSDQKRGVSGLKSVYLLIQAPKGLTSGQALLDLEADVSVRGSLMAVTLWRKKEEAAKQLTAPLWG